MSLPATNLEPFYVVDTHALIWYLRADTKLSKQALAIFQAAERGETRLLLPAMVLAELYFANVKNNPAVYNNILNKPFFRFLPFEHQHVLDFDRDYRVPEMHDRIIAGVARRLGAPLISSDPLIAAAAIVTIVW